LVKQRSCFNLLSPSLRKNGAKSLMWGRLLKHDFAIILR